MADYAFWLSALRVRPKIVDRAAKLAAASRVIAKHLGHQKTVQIAKHGFPEPLFLLCS